MKQGHEVQRWDLPQVHRVRKRKASAIERNDQGNPTAQTYVNSFQNAILRNPQTRNSPLTQLLYRLTINEEP